VASCSYGCAAAAAAAAAADGWACGAGRGGAGSARPASDCARPSSAGHRRWGCYATARCQPGGRRPSGPPRSEKRSALLAGVSTSAGLRRIHVYLDSRPPSAVLAQAERLPDRPLCGYCEWDRKSQLHGCVRRVLHARCLYRVSGGNIPQHNFIFRVLPGLYGN
jgi:hypothetical protein